MTTDAPLEAIEEDEPNGRDIAQQIAGLDDEGIDYMVRKLSPDDIDRITDAIERRPVMLARQLKRESR